MKFKKLGEDIYLPKHSGAPLRGKDHIKFNYYLTSRVHGKRIDLDITSKVFDGDKMYMRKSCYRVKIGEIENCVKNNTTDHMKSLGMRNDNIPDSLTKVDPKVHDLRLSSKNAFVD